MSTNERGITRELAQYIVSLAYDDLTDAAIAACKDAVLDQLGIMLTGSTLPWTKPGYEVICGMPGPAQSTIVGYGNKTSAPDAAFVNANFGHSCEMDDSGYSKGGSGHPGSLTVSPALALAERDHLSGRQLLLAVIAGYEVLARIGKVITPGNKGFHAQSVVGPFAAVTASGVLLKLNAEQMTNALAIAGSHSSGTHEYDRSGGEVKRVHASIAVRGGMMAALLAQRGLTGPQTILEGRYGIARIFGDATDDTDMTPMLDGVGGGRYAVEERMVKMFPTDGGMHTSFQALQRLMQENAFKACDVQEVNVWLNKNWADHVGVIRHPKDTVSAQYSMAFSVALRLTRGRNELRDYMNPEMWIDREIMSVADKVQVHVDPNNTGGEKRYGVHMEVRLNDGRTLKTDETYRKGSRQNPITRDELEVKFRSLARARLNEGRMQEVADMVYRLDEVKDTTELIPLLFSE